MKVTVVPADTGGCGRYRLIYPSQEVAKLGVDVDVRMIGDIPIKAWMDPTTNLIDVQEIELDTDLIVFQRPLNNGFHSMIQQARKQGIATIVEIDDDFSLVHNKNIAKIAMDLPHSGHRWVDKAAKAADLVTVSTPRLLKYANKGQGVVIRNYIPEEVFRIPKSDAERNKAFLWTGSVQTHPNDLQQTKGVIGELASSHGWDVNVVGYEHKVRQHLKLPKSVDLGATGWLEDPDEYFLAMRSFGDIGIVPLESSAFNEAKSYLKGLEMAALGIPFVASNTYEYNLLSLDGIGKVANSPGEWRRHLSRMMDNTSKTEREAQEARDKIKSEYTYRNRAPEWLAAWETAIENCRQSCKSEKSLNI